MPTSRLRGAIGDKREGGDGGSGKGDKQIVEGRSIDGDGGGDTGDSVGLNSSTLKLISLTAERVSEYATLGLVTLSFSLSRFFFTLPPTLFGRKGVSGE